METIIYILTGTVTGVIIGYLIAKIVLIRNHVNRTELEKAEKTIQELQLENAKKLTKEEVEENFISKEVHSLVNSQLNEMKLKVGENYVPKDSYDLLASNNGELRKQNEQKEKAILDLSKLLSELQQKEEHLNEKLTTFKKEIEALHQLSQDKFRNLANEVLEEKKKIFVNENKKELNTLLDPLKSDLTQFREKVEATRKEDIQDLTSLKKEIENLNKLNNQLSDDAKNLATALKSEVKMQGNWGEDRLNMILEVEGLQRYVDYSREQVLRDEEQERNRKPDFILRLPENKHIVIDSKVSLTAYVNYFNASSEEERQQHLRMHLKSVNDHIEELSKKNYHSLAGIHTPDYVFLFMPVESALTLALNQSPEIFNNALKKKIVMITPTTLVATLKVVKLLWQKENQVKNVEEIFRQCGELYNKFVIFLEDMERIENSLNNATNAYKGAINSLKDGARKSQTIIGRFERIRSLEAKVNKPIPEKFTREIELLPEEDEKANNTTEEKKTE